MLAAKIADVGHIFVVGSEKKKNHTPKVVLCSIPANVGAAMEPVFLSEGQC